MSATVFDDRTCFLGEGPLWHPERGQLFWFDIVNRTVLTRMGERQAEWRFDEMVSAAGWIDRDRLLICGETALWLFDIETGARRRLIEIDLGAGRRSNDGRADPWGGFWFSSMGKDAEPEAGAIYRYVAGRVETLFEGISIPNAICFSPDRHWAYFSDTARNLVRRVTLDAETGAPAGAPETFLDLGAEGLNPDGAVVDRDGNFHSAQWGAARVAVYDPRGRFVRAIGFGAPHTSCPAFGGPDFSTLYCTTAQQGLDAAGLEQAPQSGMVFAAEKAGRGLPEPRILI